MRIESAVALRDSHRQVVAADLIIGVTVDEIDEAVALWSPFRLACEQAGRRSEHAHWDWSKKARATGGATYYTIAGVRIGTEMQGLLLWGDLFSPAAKHPSQLGQDLVYVHFVSTAPWNDRELVDAPKFVGAGTLLLRTAVERSLDLGYKGRLGLHSLSKAEEFYRDKCNMIDMGIDQSHENLRYFEFTPQLAQDFLNRTGVTP